jgi:cell division ATPase FtsA
MLSGGGALIPNIDELTQRVFKVPVQIAQPKLLKGMDRTMISPENLTPIGLLCLGKQLKQMEMENAMPVRKMLKQEIGSFIKIFRRAIKF